MTERGPRVAVGASAEAAARAAGEEIVRQARAAIADHGSFTIAVSGGRSPWHMLADLDGLGMPWAATTVYQVDERIAAADDPQRNLIGLRRVLPADCPVRVVPMPVESADLAAACTEYAALLPDVLDVVQLGLGSDGHTASLIPGDPVLMVADRDVALTGDYQGRRRMTMTYPRLARARTILWLVTGTEKKAALASLLAGDPSIPATGVTAADEVLFCDVDAMGAARS